jgi:hypothetical protein
MNSSKIVVLFAALLAPLAAQQESPTANQPVLDPVMRIPGTLNEPWFDPAPAEVTMTLRRDGYVHAKLGWSLPDEKFFGAVIASFDTKMISIPGLPPLLATDILVASGVGAGTLELVLGKDDFDFTVYLQAVAGNGTEAAASPVIKVVGQGAE